MSDITEQARRAALSYGDPLYRRLADEIERLRLENARLGIAFHRAINSPKGVVPSGFEDFYEHEN